MTNETKRWRFYVTTWDDEVIYLDAKGGPNGNEPEAMFVGTGHKAIVECDRRLTLWEKITDRLAAKITRESRGSSSRKTS